VLTRYEAFQRGDYTAAANPIPAEFAAGSNASTGASLIDFDDTQEQAAQGSGGGNALNDLDTLFGSSVPSAPPAQYTNPMAAFNSAPANPPAGYAPSYAPSYVAPAPATAFSPSSNSGPVNQPPFQAASPLSQSRPQSAQFGSIMLPGSRESSPQVTGGPTWGGMSPPPMQHASSPLASQVGSPIHMQQQPQQYQQQQQHISMMQPQQQISSSSSTMTPQTQAPSQPISAAAGAKKDPFADLVGLF
jgi:ADP-ribosylation factor-binding protein GGA